MFDLLTHARMLADATRSRAYEAAIASVVRPGDVVIDLGTGTGIHAVLACLAGASRVYAIESSAIINVAREIAHANGVADRITFLAGDSRELEIPAKADVLVADIRGVLPHFGTALEAIIDVRSRMLKPEARIIPFRDTIFAALVDSESAAALHRDAWKHPRVDLSPGARRAAHATHKHLFERDEIVSSIEALGTVEYSTLTTPDLEASTAFMVQRDARANGVALWFDSELAPGVTMTNAPGAVPLIYGQLFVPFETDLQVSAGEGVQFAISARIMPGEADYLWRWRTSMAGGVVLDQSSFFAMPELRGGGE